MLFSRLILGHVFPPHVVSSQALASLYGGEELRSTLCRPLRSLSVPLSSGTIPYNSGCLRLCNPGWSPTHWRPLGFSLDSTVVWELFPANELGQTLILICLPSLMYHYFSLFNVQYLKSSGFYVLSVFRPFGEQKCSVTLSWTTDHFEWLLWNLFYYITKIILEALFQPDRFTTRFYPDMISTHAIHIHVDNNNKIGSGMVGRYNVW